MPTFVHEASARHLRRVRLEEGLVRVVCTGCRHERLAAVQMQVPGVEARRAGHGATADLNVRLHVLALDRAYTFDGERPRFHRAPPPEVGIIHTGLT